MSCGKMSEQTVPCGWFTGLRRLEGFLLWMKKRVQSLI